MSYTSYFRCCAGCSAFLATYDNVTEWLFCKKCYPKHVKPHDKWAASLTVGDTVYVQPSVAWRGLSRSRYLIMAREGDALTLQVIGIPESRVQTTIAQVGQHDLTPHNWPRHGTNT